MARCLVAPASYSARYGLGGRMLSTVIVALLVMTGAARAQEASDAGRAGPSEREKEPFVYAQAEKLFEEGLQLFRRGQFEQACRKLEASLNLVHGMGAQGKLAECYEKIGRTASAWRLYSEVASIAKERNDTLRYKVASERARALEPRVAKLTIEPGPSALVEGFAIVQNGEPVPPRVYGTVIVVDPGTYLIKATAPGHQAFSTTVKLGEGEEGTAAIAELAAADLPAAQPAVQPAAAVQAAPVEPRSRAGLYVAATGALVLAGGTTFFGLRARSQWDEAQRTGCEPERGLCYDPEAHKLSEDAHSSALMANISLAVGLGVTAAGLIWWWRSGGEAGTEASQAVRVAPSVGAAHVGVTVERHF